MSRLNIIVIALGGFAIVSALPLAVRAQSGDALAKAEYTCLEHDVGPNSVGFDTCVGRAARAYDLGNPTAADAEARKVTEARQTCLSYDIEPMTLGYRQCMANETSKIALSSYEAGYAYRP
ncbi:hypothetical protein BH10PSE6_BH10PSE6_30440 [soil metagenome]